MMLRRYFESMAGRLFLFLLVGVAASGSVALSLTSAYREAVLHSIRLERFADRMQDFVTLANSTAEPMRSKLITNGVPGLLPVTTQQKLQGPDEELSERLSHRVGAFVDAWHVAPSTCFVQPITLSTYYKTNCWRVSSHLANGRPFSLTLIGSVEENLPEPQMDPLYLLIMVLGVGLLTFLAARMAAAPLADLSRAARALGGDLDTLPLPERGPNEVRDAIEAFNTMQARLREHVVQRTKILASITHDLQTPLTRLRLRLEKVDDVALRSRLIDDLQGMQILIREGLEFSRGAQTDEPFAPIALDSLLESLVEDAVEAGQSILLTNRSNYDVEARPRALQRCLANLVDNALKYGGSAEISTGLTADHGLQIRIRDHGRGIAPDQLEKAFEPFVRLASPVQNKAEGAGLGLTIARMLAAKNDAELTLANHPEGGLEAVLTLSRGLRANSDGPDWQSYIRNDPETFAN